MGSTSKRGPSSADKTAGFGPIAERFRRGGDLERAVTLCREGLAKFPDHLSGRVTLGWALLDLGRYDEARHELEQVLKRAPDNLAAIRGLAELHDRAESTMYLDMAAPGHWPPEPPAGEGADEAAAQFAEAVAEAETAEPEPVWQAPAEAPAPIAVAFSQDDETPEIITTAQAAMAEPTAAAATVEADIAPVELETAADAATRAVESDRSAPAAEIAAEPVIIETAAQAMAASQPAQRAEAIADIAPVAITGPADVFVEPAAAVLASGASSETDPELPAAAIDEPGIEAITAALIQTPAEALTGGAEPPVAAVATAVDEDVEALDVTPGAEGLEDVMAALDAPGAIDDEALGTAAAQSEFDGFTASEAAIEVAAADLADALAEANALLSARSSDWPGADVAAHVIEVPGAADEPDATTGAHDARADALASEAADRALEAAAAFADAQAESAAHDAAVSAYRSEQPAGALSDVHETAALPADPDAITLVEQDLVPDDAIAAIAAAADVGADMAQAAFRDAAIETDEPAADRQSGLTEMHEAPAASDEFAQIHAQASASSVDAQDDTDAAAPMALSAEVADEAAQSSFHAPDVEPVVPASEDVDAAVGATIALAPEGGSDPTPQPWVDDVAAREPVAEPEIVAEVLSGDPAWEPPAVAPAVASVAEAEVVEAVAAETAAFEADTAAVEREAEAAAFEKEMVASAEQAESIEPLLETIESSVSSETIEVPEPVDLTAAVDAVEVVAQAVAVESVVPWETIEVLEPVEVAAAVDAVELVPQVEAVDAMAAAASVDAEPALLPSVEEVLGQSPSAPSPAFELELLTPAEAASLADLPLASAPIAPAVDLPEVLTTRPETPEAAPPDIEPFKPNGSAMYDGTRSMASQKAPRGRKGRHRKGKAAPARVSPVPALERLLRRVETRRAEIASESVA